MPHKIDSTSTEDIITDFTNLLNDTRTGSNHIKEIMRLINVLLGRCYGDEEYQIW